MAKYRGTSPQALFVQPILPSAVFCRQQLYIVGIFRIVPPTVPVVVRLQCIEVVVLRQEVIEQLEHSAGLRRAGNCENLWTARMSYLVQERRQDSLPEVSGAYKTPAKSRFRTKVPFPAFQEIYSGCCAVAAQVWKEGQDPRSGTYLDELNLSTQSEGRYPTGTSFPPVRSTHLSYRPRLDSALGSSPTP